MTTTKQIFGRHYLVELIGCDPSRISAIETVRQALEACARAAGATVVGESYHQFSPKGVSAVLHISFSHFALHTWPEKAYAAFDAFTCGPLKMDEAIQTLQKECGAVKVDCQMIPRGENGRRGD